MSAPHELDTYHRERTATVVAFNRSRLGLGDPDAKAKALKRRFRSITRRHERALTGRRILLKAARLTIAAAFLMAGTTAPIAIAAYRWEWPFTATARHLLAWPNCGVAREVGLAPAYRGAPGYWPHHDADQDGIACEPWPRRY